MWKNQHLVGRAIAAAAYCLVILCASAAPKNPTYANVTITCYWISNYAYSHSPDYLTIEGMTGDDYPDKSFTARLRSDFVGPMTPEVDWPSLTLRQQMSVRNMGWGQVDFGDGKNGGPNGAWAWISKHGRQVPLRGVWYLYIDHDLSPGAYPKIQLMKQTRPGNWYQGYKKSYDQVPFPKMLGDGRVRVAANSDWLPMGTVFKITRGKNAVDFHAANAFLRNGTFEVLDIGAAGQGLDLNLGLQYFEAEEMKKYTIWLPGQTEGDTRGATIQVLGHYTADGVFHPQ